MNKTENFRKSWSLVNFCEFDKYATQSYCMIHDVDPSLNLGDITQVDIEKLPTDVGLLTHGSPCQSFSAAGKQAGGDKGSGTRSSLMWNSVEIIRHCKPKLVIWENVKNVLSPKHKHNFEQYINELDMIGYNSYYKVLNAKDYGIPQNRERIYVISIRKDIDNGKFKFPEPKPLKNKLKDLLEDNVDDKYYLSDKMIRYISSKNEKWTGNNRGAFVNKTIASTLNTGEGSRRCDSSNYICDELPENANLQKFEEYVIGDFRYDEGFRPRKNGLCPCLTTKVGGASLSANPLYVTRREEIMDKNKINKIEDLKIRKLTPKETFRLMGFSDELFNKIEGVSQTQLYKQSGNSIVTDVLFYIYIELYKAIPEIFDDLKVLSLFSGIGAFEVGLDRLYRVINLLEERKQGEK